jgi:hypothetical protein
MAEGNEIFYLKKSQLNFNMKEKFVGNGFSCLGVSE